MNDRSTQRLAETVDSIIKMLLQAIRAHGWRCVLDLPKMVMLAIYLRRLGREFAALVAAIDAGKFAPAAPCADPPAALGALAGSFEAPRVVGRRAPAERGRPRVAVRCVVAAEAETAPAVDGIGCVAALPRARGRGVVRRWRPRRVVLAFAVPDLPAGAIATGRCS